MWQKINNQIARVFHYPAAQGGIGALVLVAALVSLFSEADEYAVQTRSLLHLSGEASLVLLAVAFLIGVMLTLDPLVDGLELVEDAIEKTEANHLDRFNRRLRAIISSPRFHLVLGLLIITGGIVEAVLEFAMPGGRISFWSLGMVYFGLHTTCNILARIKKSLSLTGGSLERNPGIHHLTARLSRFLGQPWISNSLAIIILISGLASGVLNQWLLGVELEASGSFESSNAGTCVFAVNTLFHNILVINDAEQVIDDEVTAVLEQDSQTAGTGAGEG